MIFYSAALLSIYLLGALGDESPQNNPSDFVEEQMNTMVLPVAFEFKVFNDTAQDSAVTITPAMVDAAHEVVSSCLVSSYNSYHDPSQHKTLSVDIDRQEIYDVPVLFGKHTSLQDSWYNTYNKMWAWQGTCTYVGCQHCDPKDDEDPFTTLEEGTVQHLHVMQHSHPIWEERLCTCLEEKGQEQSVLSILATSFDCDIRRGDRPAESVTKSEVLGEEPLQNNPSDSSEEPPQINSSESVGDQKNTMVLPVAFEFKVFNDTDKDSAVTITPGMKVAAQEIVSSCLFSSYNSYHDPSQHKTLSVDLARQEIFDVPVMFGKYTSIQDSWYNTYNKMWAWQGTCYYVGCQHCDPKDDEDPFTTLEEGTVQHLNAVQHSHPIWEDRLCTCLEEKGQEQPVLSILTTSFDCDIRRGDRPVESVMKLEATQQAENVLTPESKNAAEEKKKVIRKRTIAVD